jgi:hypothetical protein
MHIKNKAFTVFVLAVFVLPLVASAQSMTVPQMQAQIASLMAEVRSLEQQLAAAGGTTGTWCYSFDTNLRIGMAGPDVTALQTALQKDGESVTVNGTFDDQTASAVTGFQQKYASVILAPYGLQNGTGYAGKSTRAELNSLYGCGMTTPPLASSPSLTSNPTSATSGAGSLTVSQSGSIQDTVTPGQTGVLIGSYSLAASQAEGISLNTRGRSIGTAYFQNVRVYVNGSQFGVTWSQPTSGGSYTFSAFSPTSIPVGTTAKVQIFADTSSSATGGQVSPATSVTGCAASGMTANDAVTCNATSGQGLTFGGNRPETNPWAEVQPTTLQFVATPGASNAQVSPKTLLLYASAAEPIVVSASSAQGWLQAVAPQSSVSPDGTPNAASITVTALPGSLAAGTYTGTVTVSSPTNQFSSIVIPVTLTVTSVVSAQPATVLAPVSGTTWVQGTTQNIQWQTASPGQPMGMGLFLMQNGTILNSIATPSNVGTYAWTIPSSYAGSNFQIRVMASGVPVADSGMFSIVAPAVPSSTTSSVPTGSLTVSQLETIPNSITPGQITVGQGPVLIGSYSFRASQNEGINLSSVSFSVGSSYFQDVGLETEQYNPNGTPAYAVWEPTSSGGSYTFAGSVPILIPRGDSVIVRILARSVSSLASGSVSAATTITGCAATGAASGASIPCNSVSGPSITFTNQ